MQKLTLIVLSVGGALAVHGQAWTITGNNNTNPAIHFLGTTSNQPLKFRVNNVYSGEIDSSTNKTFFGFGAGRATTGVDNMGLGFKAMTAAVSGSRNTAVGNYALSALSDGWYNTAVGNSALEANTTGSDNTAVGRNALGSNISGYSNASLGNSALSHNLASENTAVGAYSMTYNTTGTTNAAGGTFALYLNNGGSNNVGFGAYSLYYNFNNNNNTAIGFQSMFSTRGDQNTGVGSQTLRNNQYGQYNTALGYNAIYNTTGSYYNTAIGYRAGANYDMGWNNTILGANCDMNGPGMYNIIAIGQGVVCTASSQARIGNSATNSIGGYANWTNISDVRYKKDIAENVPGLNFIMKLKPITYHLDITGLSNKLKENNAGDGNEKSRQAIAEKERVVWTGFSGQQVDEAAKEIGYDFSGVDKPKNENDLYGLRYSEFVVPLVKAVQEQQKMIESLTKENSELQKRVAELEKRPGNLITMTTGH